VRKAVLSILLCLLSAHAPAAPASAESVDRLLKVARVEAMLDSMYATLEQIVRGSMQQAIAGRPVTPEQQRAIDAMPAKLMTVVRQEFTWDVLRPQYARLYGETFSQEEIDGLVAFYESPAGQAFVSKMPIVLQKSVALSQAQMKVLLPKMNAAIAEAIRDAKLAN
jgi:hypothetical protein